MKETPKLKSANFTLFTKSKQLALLAKGAKLKN